MKKPCLHSNLLNQNGKDTSLEGLGEMIFVTLIQFSRSWGSLCLMMWVVVGALGTCFILKTPSCCPIKLFDESYLYIVLVQV